MTYRVEINSTPAVIGRLYRAALLAPNQRVGRKLQDGTLAYIKLIPGNKINLALMRQDRWPDTTTWEKAIDALPVEYTDPQRMKTSQGYFLYAKDVPLHNGGNHAP